MKKHIKERVIGSTILIGGGILMTALIFRADNKIKQSDNVLVTNEQVQENSQHSSVELTADYDTEKALLAKKRDERTKKIEEREAKVQEILKKQTNARKNALEKAEAEHDLSRSNITLQPEYTEAQITAQRQKNLKQQAINKKFLQKAQAEAEALKNLQKKQALEAQKLEDYQKRELARAKQEQERQQQIAEKKAQAEVARIKLAKEKAESKEKNYINARNKLKLARKKANQNDKNYAVQIALAANQENATALAKSLRVHGYKVITSKTRRGVRVVVGPEKGQAPAYALRTKLQADKRINVSDAWITAYDSINRNTVTTKKKNPQHTKTQHSSNKPSNTAQNTITADTERKYKYGVQVAMAGSVESKNALVAKLQKSGYAVTTSHTSRGTRILVGGGLTKKEALKLQRKVNTDKRIGISGAWIKRKRSSQ